MVNNGNPKHIDGICDKCGRPLANHQTSYVYKILLRTLCETSWRKTFPIIVCGSCSEKIRWVDEDFIRFKS